MIRFLASLLAVDSSDSVLYIQEGAVKLSQRSRAATRRCCNEAMAPATASFDGGTD
jgi:hypothetical protein